MCILFLLARRGRSRVHGRPGRGARRAQPTLPRGGGSARVGPRGSATPVRATAESYGWCSARVRRGAGAPTLGLLRCRRDLPCIKKTNKETTIRASHGTRRRPPPPPPPRRRDRRPLATVRDCQAVATTGVVGGDLREGPPRAIHGAMASAGATATASAHGMGGRYQQRAEQSRAPLPVASPPRRTNLNFIQK